MWESVAAKTPKPCAVAWAGRPVVWSMNPVVPLEMCKSRCRLWLLTYRQREHVNIWNPMLFLQLKQQTPYQLERAGRLTHLMLYEKAMTSIGELNGMKLCSASVPHFTAPRPMTRFGTSAVVAVTKRDSSYSYLPDCAAQTTSTIAAITVIRPVV